MEMSHSGLVHYLGKVATGKPVREFKSLRLRQGKGIRKILNFYFKKGRVAQLVRVLH